jgi:hypothetical protein
MWTEYLNVPEGGATFMFLLLAGLSCSAAIFFKYRNQPKKCEIA